MRFRTPKDEDDEFERAESDHNVLELIHDEGLENTRPCLDRIKEYITRNGAIVDIDTKKFAFQHTYQIIKWVDVSTDEGERRGGGDFVVRVDHHFLYIICKAPPSSGTDTKIIGATFRFLLPLPAKARGCRG